MAPSFLEGVELAATAAAGPRLPAVAPAVRGNPAFLLVVGAAAIALFASLFFSTQAGLFILAAAWIAAASFRCPKEAFFLLIFVAPLLPILKATQVASIVTPLKDVVIATLLIKTTILPIAQKRDPYRRNTLLVALALFLVWALVGFLRADSMVLGLLRLRDLILYIPLLWIARQSLTALDDLRTFLRVVVGGGALVLLLVGLQFFAFPDGMVLRYDPVLGSWIPRASGTLAHPNLLGSYLLFLIPLAASLLLARSFSLRARTFSAIVAVVGLLALFFTYSRSGWIATAVALLALGALVVVLKRRLILPGVVLGGTMLLMLGTLVPGVRTFLRTVADPTYPSNAERLEILAGLVATASPTSAIIGEGLGDVASATLRTVNISLTNIAAADVRQVQIAKARTFVDNAILKTWAELGVVGIALLLWITTRVIVLSWRESRTARTPEGRAFARALLATTSGLVALSFFLDVPEIFPVALYWWAFVGVAHALPYIEE